MHTDVRRCLKKGRRGQDWTSRLVRKWDKAAALEKHKNRSRRSASLAVLVVTFAERYLSGRMEKKSSIGLMIRDGIATIQKQIAEQLDEILHHPDFQALESRWRGLWFFIGSTQLQPDIRVRVLTVSRNDLLIDFEKASQFDQSSLFKHVYEKEFGSFGGTPYSFLIGDYMFSKSNHDLSLLQNIARVASAAHAPFLAGVSPCLMGLNSFEELGYPRILRKLFETKELSKWNSFRDTEDSRYVALVLPRILLRLPHGKADGRLNTGTIQYEERMDGDTQNYLWGNAAYALGQRICKSHQIYGWMARFLGVDESGSGVVTGLPVPRFDALPIPKMSTEVLIVDSVEKELSNQGFVCLSHCKMTTSAAFFNAQTVHRQKKYLQTGKTANDRLSSLLPHVLTASRFAHYLKSMMRDKIGKLSNKLEIEDYLNNWINRYVLTQTNSSTELKSQHPLQESWIKVFDDSSRPGHYKILSCIRPHYQLEALSASIQLVSTLPAPSN